MIGGGHPLPGSDEARHNEIPERAEAEKGRGDDPAPVVQPDGDPVTPDGEPYRYADLGRGPEPGPARRQAMSDRRDSGELPREQDRNSAGSVGGTQDRELAEDQAAHQERGQTKAEEEERGG